jgi:hypothetical protein
MAELLPASVLLLSVEALLVFEDVDEGMVVLIAGAFSSSSASPVAPTNTAPAITRGNETAKILKRFLFSALGSRVDCSSSVI